MLFAQDKKVQHSSTALRNVLADKEQTQSKLGATLAAMEEEMAEREAGWEAERGGLQAMLAAKGIHQAKQATARGAKAMDLVKAEKSARRKAKQKKKEARRRPPKTPPFPPSGPSRPT